MATKKQSRTVREALSVAGDCIEVGAFLAAAVTVIYSVAKSAAGIPILLTGLSVVALAILVCLLVLLIRRE